MAFRDGALGGFAALVALEGRAALATFADLRAVEDAANEDFVRPAGFGAARAAAGRLADLWGDLGMD